MKGNNDGIQTFVRYSIFTCSVDQLQLNLLCNIVM